MKVLDLFGGYGTMSTAFKDRGHEVFIVDYNESCSPDLMLDVFTVSPREFAETYGPFDVCLLSPPCQAFSVAQIGRNWHVDEKGGVGSPKTPKASEAIRLVLRGITYVEAINPSSWWLENPVGALRKMSFMSEFQHAAVDYCQYRVGTKKPTDLWGSWEGWIPRPQCTRTPRKHEVIYVTMEDGEKVVPYVTDVDGEKPCHIYSPRGSQDGTQNPGDKYVKNPFPYPLCLDLCLAAEGRLVAERASLLS